MTVQIIEHLIKSVLIHQPVVLSSGEQSDYYYDVKKLLLSPQSLYKIKLAVHQVLWDNGMTTHIKSIGGMETGSIPLVTALCEAMNLFGFYVRKQAKLYGLKKQIEGTVVSPVLLVEDVITTGHSLIDAIDIVRKEAKILAVISVVDRTKKHDNLDGVFVAKGIKYYTLYKHKEE